MFVIIPVPAVEKFVEFVENKVITSVIIEEKDSIIDGFFISIALEILSENVCIAVETVVDEFRKVLLNAVKAVVAKDDTAVANDCGP